MKTVFRHRALKKVLVTLDTGDTFQGLLFKVDSEAVVLRSAGVVDTRADTPFTPADGELVLPKSRIAYYQFP